MQMSSCNTIALIDNVLHDL